MNITRIAFLLCLCTNTLFAQEVTISEIDQLIEEAASNTFLTRDEDIKILNKIDRLSRKIDYPDGIMKANLALAGLNRDYTPDIALKYISICDSLRAIHPKIFTHEILVQLNLNKGYTLGESGDLLSELNHYLIADSISQKSERKDLQSLTDQYLCSYYHLKEDYRNALAYNRKLIAYYDEFGYASIYLISLLNAGSIYQQAGEVDSTIYYVNLAIDQGLGDHENLMFPYTLLGDAYLKKEDFEKAKYYVEQMRLAQDSSSLFSVDGVLANILSGEVNLRLNELDQAKEDFTLALSYADSIDYINGQNQANYYLIKTHLQDHGDTELISNLQDYVSGMDSVHANKSYKLEKQLLVQYETAKKETEIEQLKHKNEINKNMIVIISLSSLILILIIVFALKVNKNKRKLLKRNLEVETIKKTALNNELNQAIRKIKEHAGIIEEFKKKDFGNEGIETIIEVLDQNYITENEWAKVILHFDLLNDNFTKKLLLKYPDLTVKEVRLTILIQLGFSNKGILEINNITENGVKKAKQRLLKKLNIDSFSQLSLR